MSMQNNGSDIDLLMYDLFTALHAVYYCHNSKLYIFCDSEYKIPKILNMLRIFILANTT